MSKIITPVTADVINGLLLGGSNVTLTVVGGVLEISATVSGSLTSYYVEQEAETTNATTTYSTKATLTQTLTAGDYLVQWSYQAKNGDANKGFIIAMTVDGTDINVSEHVQQRKSSPIDYAISSGIRRMTFTASSHTFILRFRSQSAGNTTSIKNARISLLKLT